MKPDKKTIVLITIIILLVILDQGLKIYSFITSSAIINMEIEQGEQNSILSTSITYIIVFGIIIKFFVNQKEKIGMNLVVAIALLLAGGISNLIDKIYIGSVINYIKIYNLPSMNLSFIFIVISWIGLASIFAWNTYKEFKEKENAQK